MKTQHLEGFIGIAFADKKDGVKLETERVTIPLDADGHGDATLTKNGVTHVLSVDRDPQVDLYGAYSTLLRGEHDRLGADAFLFKNDGISKGFGWDPAPAGADKLALIDRELSPQFFRLKASDAVAQRLKKRHATPPLRWVQRDPVFVDASTTDFVAYVKRQVQRGTIKAGDPVAAVIVGASFVRVTDPEPKSA